eukprot:1387989-Prorocentrum_lima.AAC.1
MPDHGQLPAPSLGHFLGSLAEGFSVIPPQDHVLVAPLHCFYSPPLPWGSSVPVQEAPACPLLV